MKCTETWAAVLLAAAALPAAADTVSVKLDGFVYPPIQVQWHNHAVWAGEYYGHAQASQNTDIVPNEHLLAWCYEPEAFLQFGSTVEYTILDANAGFAPDVATELAQLLSWLDRKNQPNDAETAAVVQKEIWRIREGEVPFGFYDGPISILPALLVNGNRQDILIGVPLDKGVPVNEPNPGLVWAVGLGLLGWSRFRM